MNNYTDGGDVKFHIQVFLIYLLIIYLLSTRLLFWWTGITQSV